MYFACQQRVPSWSFLSLPLLPMYVHQAKSSAPNQRGTGRSPPVVQPGHTETLPICGDQLQEALQAPCPLASPLPCPRPGAHCQGNRGGEAGGDSKGRTGRKQMSPAQPAKWGFRELIRAMVKLGLPSHHIARTQAQMSFGHVRRGMLGHTTSYYRRKRGALCKVGHLSLLPISNIMALMSG